MNRTETECPRLSRTLSTWGIRDCKSTLKHELEGLGPKILPLHLGTTQGGVVDDSRVTVSVFGISDKGKSIQAEVGVFFSEIIAGCSCGDEPQAEPAYCRLQITIDKETAEASFEIVAGES